MPLDLSDPDVRTEVDALLTEAKAGLEKKNSELLDELKPLKRKIQALDGVDLDEYNRLREEAAAKDEADAKKRGEFDKLREQMAAKHAEELKGREGRISALQTALEREAIEGAIVRELGGAGATEEGLDLLPEKLRRNVRLVEEEDGTFAVRVVDGDTVQVDAEGKPKTVRSLIEEAKTKYPSAFTASGGSGGGFRPGANGSGPGAITVEQAEKMSPREYAEARRKGLL